jgi:hypothetical protein
MDSRRSPTRSRAWVLTLVVTMMATYAFAAANDHAGGLFVRVAPGYGMATTTLAAPGYKQEIIGPAVAVDVAVGVVIVEDLVLHGTVYGTLTSNPDSQVQTAKSEIDGDLLGTAFGIGLTQYFMPANFYVSASGGAGRHKFDFEDGSGFDTDYGLFVDVSIGKEWWVTGSWGLGLAGGFQYHSFGDPELAANWKGLTYNLRITATLN